MLVFRRRRLTEGPRKPRRHLKKLRLLILLLVTVVVGLIAFTFGFITALGSGLPDLDPANQARLQSQTKIYANDGKTVLAVLRGDEARIIVTSDQIAPVMKQAIVAIEDQRYWAHKGLDLRGIARAAWADIRNQDFVQGGSTITQQFIKNAYIEPEDTVSRKLKEAALAWQLERTWSKDKILTAYLNTVFFGNDAYGIELASKVYFQKRASGLTLPEAALLAGIPQNPSRFDPVTKPKQAKARRDLVLRLMLEQQLITEEEFLEARQTPLPATGDIELPSARGPAGYFTEYVKSQLIPEFGSGKVFGGGLEIYTTVDLELQKLAKDAVREWLPDPKGPQAALVAIDPRSGEVLAMVGGQSFSKTQFNLAVQGERQSGSAFKPFVLAAALDEGIATSHKFRSKPVVIQQAGDYWAVNNYEGVYLGEIDIERATIASDNSVYAQLTAHTGPQQVADIAHALGILRDLDPFLSIGLGTQDVSPLEMARAYATFATSGGRVDGMLLGNQPRAVLAVRDGDTLQTNNAVRKRVLDIDDAAIVNSVLQKVVSQGTGKRARIQGRTVAGKTGTTENFGDAWFVGYTPQLAVAVWVGYPNKLRPMLKEFDGDPVAGGTFPALIWKTFVESALDAMGEPPRSFRAPPTKSTQTVRVVNRNGTWLRDNGRCQNTRAVVYYTSDVPSKVAACKRNEVQVPDVIGEKLRTAESRLAQQPLQADVKSRPAEPGEKLGVVVDQDPKRGTLSSYDTVRLVIAKATEGVVPNVIGMTIEEAEELLVSRKLQAVVAGEGEGEAGVVVTQSPRGRVAATPGMQIELTVGGSQPDVAKSPR